ncbi:hypothetical protein C5167_016409 [Papaver somniferum]|nr:hypothetical protein C5167_016409 [Papaver somniferum]
MPIRNLIPQPWRTYQFVPYFRWRRHRAAAKCRWIQGLSIELASFPGKAAGVKIASGAAAAPAVEAAKVSCSLGFLDMFKYVISTKMEVLNSSQGGPNYSALPFVKMDIGE